MNFDMQPRIVKANDKVVADRGRIAVEKGPVVYCAEWPDNSGISVRKVLVSKNPDLKVSRSSILGGVDMISAKAQAMLFDADGRMSLKDVELKLIPYYAWCHRGSGEMSVWLPQEFRAFSTYTE